MRVKNGLTNQTLGSNAIFFRNGGVGRICPISNCQWLLKVLERYIGLRTSNASPAQFRRCSWREVIAAAGDVVL